MRARGAVAFAVALVAFLAAGLWLGGHPRSLPEPLRDVFVDETGGLTAEAAEAIEDSYYRAVGGQELSNASLQGMVKRAAPEQRGGPLLRILLAGSAGTLQRSRSKATSRGSGSTIRRGQGGPARWPRSSRARRPRRPGSKPGTRSSRSKGSRSPAQSSAEATKKIKGPEGTQVTLGVRDGKSGKARQLTITRAEVSLPNVSSSVEQVDGQEARLRAACSASAKAPTPSSPARSRR